MFPKYWKKSLFFLCSGAPAKADTSIPDHFNSESPTNNSSDDFADFATFSSSEQTDPGSSQSSKPQLSDQRPESINISHKPSDNRGLSDINNDRNNYQNVNGQLVDSGVYSSNVSPVQCEENSGANHLQNIDDTDTSKSQPPDDLSCSVSEKLENTSVENEISNNKCETGRTIPSDDSVSDSQENVSDVNNSETNSVTEFQDDSDKCIPPNNIPENDHVHISGSLKDDEMPGDVEEENKSANVVIPNCDSDAEDTLSSDNTLSVSNFSNQESGREQNVNLTDLNKDIPDLKLVSEEEINERNSSDLGNFSNESVKPLEIETEQESDRLQTINTECNELRDQQGAEACVTVSAGDSDTSVVNNGDKNDEHKIVDINNGESSSEKDKCENNEILGLEGSDSEIANVENNADISEQTGIFCESSDNKMMPESEDDVGATGQIELDNESDFENNSKSVEDLNLSKGDIEEDLDNSGDCLQDEPVSDNNNSNSQEEPCDVNAIIKENEDPTVSEDVDDDFGDFSTSNVTTVEEFGEFNTSFDKKENGETESDDFGEFNANFETKPNNDSLVQKEDEEFGEFDANFETKPNSEQKEDEDFGDFNASFDSKPFSSTSEIAENNEEFSNFNASFPENSDNKEPHEDDFGDFNTTFDNAPNVNEQTNDWASFSEPQTVNLGNEEEEDDDWAGFEGEDSSTPSQSETVTAQNKMEDTAKFANMVYI